jgi:hypothetical protein
MWFVHDAVCQGKSGLGSAPIVNPERLLLSRRSMSADWSLDIFCMGPLSEALSETCQSAVDCSSESVENGNNAAQKVSSLGGFY